MLKKCQPEDMELFKLDYGDLIRPPYRILRGYSWAQGTNMTDEYLVVYGPKHPEERSIFDTSPYILPPGATTPDRWDCDGFLLPSDRELQRALLGRRRGPAAVKFWGCRRFRAWSVAGQSYRCSWDNGFFAPSQINWAIPNFTYDQIRTRLSRT